MKPALGIISHIYLQALQSQMTGFASDTRFESEMPDKYNRGWDLDNC